MASTSFGISFSDHLIVLSVCSVKTELTGEVSILSLNSKPRFHFDQRLAHVGVLIVCQALGCVEERIQEVDIGW
jgi:hypothetical protein